MEKYILSIIKLILGISIIIIPAVLLLTNLIYNKYCYPPKMPIKTTPDKYNLNYENISFKSSDGINLKAWFIKGNKNKPAVLVLHGLGTNREDVMEISVLFHNLGSSVLTFDFRGHGESGRARTTFGYSESLDVQAAFDYLRENKSDYYNGKIGIYGLSMGGAAALIASDTEYTADFLILDTVYSKLEDCVKRYMKKIVYIDARPLYKYIDYLYYRQNGEKIENVNPVNNIHFYKNKPVLLIYSDEDELVPMEEGVKLQEKCPEADIIIINNKYHGGAFSKGKSRIVRKITSIYEKLVLYDDN